MNNLKQKPMVKYSATISNTTTDYNFHFKLSKVIATNPRHINRLKKSMADNYLFTVIVVNEKL